MLAEQPADLGWPEAPKRGAAKRRQHAARHGTAQAASLYLFTYYLGASTFGTLEAHAWTSAGWLGVALVSAALLGAVPALALILRRTPSLLGH